MFQQGAPFPPLTHSTRQVCGRYSDCKNLYSTIAGQNEGRQADSEASATLIGARVLHVEETGRAEGDGYRMSDWVEGHEGYAGRGRLEGQTLMDARAMMHRHFSSEAFS